jgi:hypothetical protein
MEYTHRVAYLIEFGEIPAGAVIMHTCDNPRCVNPIHLRAGTQKDNMQDAKKKGRLVPPPINLHLRGENSPCSKISEAQAVEIRGSSETQSVLAARFGISQTQVCRIRTGIRWKTIPSPTVLWQAFAS